MDNTLDVSKRRRLDVNMDKLSDHYTVIDEIVEEETLGEHFADNEAYEYSEEKYDVAVIAYDPQLDVSSFSRDEETSPDDGTTMPKRKSKTLTIKEKYDIIKLVEEGTSVPSICNKFGIGRTTVYDFIKSKQKIIDYVEKSTNMNRRTFKRSNYPEVEERMDEWCQERDCFTKKEFFEVCREIFTESRTHSSLPSQLSQSWSWCHRFFERHPEHKQKLISSNGDSFLIAKEEYFDENESKQLITVTPANLNLKLKKDIAEDLEAGESIQDIARKYKVSKATIYNIFKSFKAELCISNKSHYDSRVSKSTKHSKLERELLKWCLEQQVPPSNAQICEKAVHFFDTLQKGVFHPTSSWAKTFIQRHAELREKIHANVLQVNKIEISEKENMNVRCMGNEACYNDSLSLMDHELIVEEEEAEEEDDDYIVEELDLEINESEIEYLEEVEYETEASVENQIENVSDADAMNSLRTLIKYAEQHRHFDYLNLFLEYQNFIPQ
jgi:transposase